MTPELLWALEIGSRRTGKPEPSNMRCELSDHEWAAFKPKLPNKPRGIRRANDRRVLNGIFWVLRGHPSAGRRLVL